MADWFKVSKKTLKITQRLLNRPPKLHTKGFFFIPEPAWENWQKSWTEQFEQKGEYDA